MGDYHSLIFSIRPFPMFWRSPMSPFVLLALIFALCFPSWSDATDPGQVRSLASEQSSSRLPVEAGESEYLFLVVDEEVNRTNKDAGFDFSPDLKEVCEMSPGSCTAFGRFAAEPFSVSVEDLAAIRSCAGLVVPGNEFSIRLSIANLLDHRDEPDARKAIVKRILDDGRPLSLLRRYGPDVEFALQGFDSEEEMRLLALVGPSEDMKTKLQGNPKLPVDAQAWLGDRSAEEELIVSFEKCVEECGIDSLGDLGRSEELIFLTQAVARLESSRSRAVLSEALSSPRLMSGAVRSSVSFAVLQGLEREHPEDATLSKIFRFVGLNQHEFSAPHNRDQLREIVKHLATRYGLNVVIRCPFFYESPRVPAVR